MNNKVNAVVSDLEDEIYGLRCTIDNMSRLMLEAARTIEQQAIENAKLRELVRDMWPHVWHRSRMCAECELPCDESDECLLYEPMRDRMQELGIEVDE